MNMVRNITDTATGFVEGVYDGGMNVATSGTQRMNILYATGGLVVSTLVGGLMTMLPFQRIPMGNVVRTGSLAFVGAGLFNYGMKRSSEPLGMASMVGGPILFGTAVAQTLGYFGLFPSLQTTLTKNAEDGYLGNMTLKGYKPIQSVEVDRTSYQPTMDYGAEGVASPQVQIAQRQEGSFVDSVREEPLMGHGVTQWFGADQADSAEPTKTGSMKSFMDSTDAFGNRTSTGDKSMANVVGGTSMADRPLTTTMYDVTVTGAAPNTRQLQGERDIIESYMMPSAGDSGRGVTQWYAESNQTGFVGRFIAGAEGHGSVIGQ